MTPRYNEMPVALIHRHPLPLGPPRSKRRELHGIESVIKPPIQSFSATCPDGPPFQGIEPLDPLARQRGVGLDRRDRVNVS